MIKISSYNYIVLLVLFVSFGNCGGGENSQFTSDLAAAPFVSKLYGKSVKTIAIQAEAGSHIAWMGLDQSGDYKLFKIEKIVYNGRDCVPGTVSSTTVLENISVGDKSATATGCDLGESVSTSISTTDQILVTISYNPSRAISSQDTPHSAHLLVTYDRPALGIVRVELKGMTQGVIPGKCVRSAESMRQVVYSVSQLNLYICDVNAFPENKPELINSNRGEKTNVKEIPIPDDFVFYLPDDNTVCMLGDRDDVEKPSIPNFTLPIPPGISDTTDKLNESSGGLSVKLSSGSFAECAISGEKNIFCDTNVNLEVLGGQVPVSPLTLSNTEVSPTSKDCQKFNVINGEVNVISGKGKFAEKDLTLIGWGMVGVNSNTTQYKIDHALFVAEIELSKK